MINRLVRFYNQNRRRFWTIAFCIIVVLTIIRGLNSNYKNVNKNKVNTNNLNSIYTDKNYSLLSGKKVTEKKSKSINETIGNFVKYCNNGEIENAYNLLSNDCKKELFPTQEIFENNYCKNIFTEYRIYDAQAWILEDNLYTYKISITEDILATGGSKSELAIEDYFTIVSENNIEKLNIKNFVKKEKVNFKQAVNNIVFNVIEKNTYIDYETYTLNITNSTDNTILINDKQNKNSVYVQDGSKHSYEGFLNENALEELIIEPGVTKTVKIRFNKVYNTKHKTKKIVFNNVILDYNNINNSNKVNAEIEI